MIDAIARDLRFAARGLRRHPGFAAAAMLTLAIGIGATTAVFGVVYGVLYRPLPFPNADRLVQIVQVLEPTPNSPEPIRAGLMPDQFADLQERSKVLQAVGSYAYAPRTLTGIGVPVRLSGAGVTPGLFAALGVAPLIGRTFVPEDGERPVLTDPVVILSHRTWSRYFGADPGIVERRITLGDTRPLVVGVMPEGFGFPSLAGSSIAMDSAGGLEDAPEFWLAMAPYQRSDGAAGGFSLFQAFAVLRENVTPAQALAEVRSLVAPLPGGRRAGLEIVTARREMGAEISDVLTIFQLGVALILLIACVNVANLLLTRAAHRRRETAIRIALGASSGRVVREHVAEAVLLALAGGTLGCAVAYGLTAALGALPPHLLPRLGDIRVDAVVVLFALALSAGTGILVGLFSGVRAARGDATGLAASQALRGLTVSPHRRLRPSGVLVIVEIAATMVLLTGAGLLINSFTRLMQVDPGFVTEGAATFRLALPGSRYPSAGVQQDLVRNLLTSIRGLPGVESAAATSHGLDGGPIGFSRLVINGRAASAEIRYRFITPDYFRTLQTPLQQGREFRDSDRASAALHAIVNDAFVNRYLEGRPAVGTTIGYGDRTSLEIIGVVGNSRARLDDDPQPALYLPPDAQAPFVQPSFVIRASASLPAVIPAIRDIVRRADPQLAVYNVVTLDQMLDHAAASARLYTMLSLWCAVIALVLAGIGLYGVLAYSVGTRTHELGIRMALGADAGRIVATVVSHGLALSGAGIAAGIAGSLYLSRFLEVFLFDLTPRDITTYGAAVAVFAAVTILACYFPSRRATRVNSVVALRAE